MTYKEKIIKAISLTKNFDEIDYIQDKIKTTEQINRRTKRGRELKEELLDLIQQRKIELAEVLLPF